MRRQVVLSAQQTPQYSDIRQVGQTLVVEFLRTSAPESLRRKLDVTDFGTPVQSISTSQAIDRVRMVVDARGSWEHSAYQTDNQFVVQVKPLKEDPNKLFQGTQLRGYQGDKISLNFQNIEVRALLQVILQRPEHASYFALKWADILQNRGAGYSTSKQRAGTTLFAGWIRDSIAANKPYDQFVSEILTASGSQNENPPAIWFRTVRKSPEYVESVSLVEQVLQRRPGAGLRGLRRNSRVESRLRLGGFAGVDLLPH